MADDKECACPHCGRPWSEVEAARRRFSRIARGNVSLEEDIAEPGFVADLRILLREFDRRAAE